MSDENSQGFEQAGHVDPEASQEPCWTFLSNHALVTMCLVDDPFMRMRDVAVRVGITERAVQRILTELEASGYITRHRDGRRNRYTVHLNQSIGHPLTGNSSIFDLMKLHARRNGGLDAGSNRMRPIVSQAANGTSFGRRRGPVARPAQATQVESSNGHSNGKTNFEVKPSENGTTATRTRGRPRKSVQTA